MGSQIREGLEGENKELVLHSVKEITRGIRMQCDQRDGYNAWPGGCEGVAETRRGVQGHTSESLGKLY